MRILVATGLFPPEIGGPATYAKLLADALPNYGVGVTVLPFSRVRYLPRGVRHGVYFFLLLREGRRADLLYAQDAVSVGLPTALAALALQKRFWLRVPGDHAWEQGVARYGIEEPLEMFVGRVRHHALQVRILAAVERWVAKRAQRVIVPSQYLKAIVGAWGVDAEKVSVMYNVTAVLEPAAFKAELKQRLGLSGCVILSSGRLVPWKGFPALIAAMEELLSAFPDVQLLIAGEGEERERLETLARQRGLEGRVRLLGKLSKEALFDYIQAADVFALNTFYEGMSHQLLEVMMLETPVVTTFAGGNTELIEDGAEGLLVRYNDRKALADALQRILSDEALGKQLSQRARRKALAFAQRDPVGELANLLKRA